MSIPPLVCSTPPPPEQVECDDARHDGFAVQYGLSQDDDDEFCTYEDFQSTVPSSPYHRTPHVDDPEKLHTSNTISSERPDKSENSECDKEYVNILSAHVRMVDEDNNIEDLDLKFEHPSTKPNTGADSKNSKSVTSIDSPETQSRALFNEESTDKNVESDIETVAKKPVHCQENITYTDLIEVENVNIEGSETENVNLDESEYSPSTEELQDVESNSKIYHTESSGIELSGDLSLEKEEDFTDFNLIPTEINLEQEVLGDLGFHETLNVLPHQETQLKEGNETAIDDNLNDFDTFQFNDTNDIENILSSGDSDPWKSDVAPVDDFGDFHATFNDNLNSTENETPFAVEDKQSEIIPHTPVEQEEDENDDFGDFDDFKSSELAQSTTGKVETAENDGSSFSIKSFEFKNTDSESQIYERIEKAIHSLYEEHISEQAQEAWESNLESTLSETWCYLTETEIRQPYMLNWNNSIGQKALLKSLCIDSRNILFGPKWNNMPRYAANLGAAPLQPMKQVSVSVGSTSGTHGADHAEGDRPNSLKPIDAWSDSLANEGQESCNDTDSQSKASVAHSDAVQREFPIYKEATSKPGKAFPNTLTLQPLRQINLPDTHIFTPTDSEVPRSKTIHYDSISPAELSQQIVNNQTKVIHSHEEIQDEQRLSSQTDNEYDDFQDFQDDSTHKLPDSNTHFNSSSKITDFNSASVETSKEFGSPITYQTQTILEPIKLEPTLPKLNWPEPGEVKETFDDFSHFVTNSSWSFSAAASALHNANDQNVDPHKDALKLSSQSENDPPTENVTTTAGKSTEPVEDDFDNFQFAPVEPPADKLQTSPRLDSPSQVMPMQQKQNANSFPLNGLLNPTVPLKMQSTTIPTHPTVGPSVASPSQILQPVQLDRFNHSGQDKMSSQQILQPLSLESFSQINWPSPGVDLQDLSRFNPINAVRSLHQSPSGGKPSSPAHSVKSAPLEDDGWGDFVSIKPTKSPSHPAKSAADDDDWSDFVSSSSSKALNGVNTISFNVQTNFAAQKPSAPGRGPDDARIAIPTLNYITPKTNHRVVRESHFQNL